MTSYVTPKINTEYIVDISLSLAGVIVTSPTISTGDFKVSTDNGTLNNITANPSVVPASSGNVKIILSASEMNGANIFVKWHDPDGTWDDGWFTIQTTENQIDDLLPGENITVEEIWSYTTRTITGLSITVQDLLDSLDQTVVNIRRGDTYVQVFNSPEVLSGYTNIWMTLKGNLNRTESDPEAIFQIKLNASGVGDGLLYVNGAPAADSSLGSLTANIVNNTITAELHQDVTASFTPVMSKPVDIQMLIDGDTKTIVDGIARIYGDVTRSLV